MEQVRAFIAIELPEELKQELTELEAGLKSGKQSWVKWVDPSGIHLTLKFLGNIAVSRIDGIIKAMREAVRGIKPFKLIVNEIGAFPNLRRVQVVWVGVDGDTVELGQLQKRIESNLAPLGFTPETRSFKPHLTLARLRDQASPDQQQRFGQLIAATRFKSASTVRVDTISLIRSVLTREGAIYSRLGLVELGND